MLLALIAKSEFVDSGTTPALDNNAWARLDALAAAHRVQPMLDWLHGTDPGVPESIRQGWRNARRLAAAEALLIGRELTRTVDLLNEAGLAPVALKGAWLAWHAYPEPSLRPMRDIDLLLPDDTASAAFHCLVQADYREAAPGAAVPVASDPPSKHLPPLVSPGGIWIELHQRLAEPEGRMDHCAPAAPLAAASSRTSLIGGRRFLDPTDLVAHLVIHAAYDHRLDCGPLVLPDIRYALAAAPIDWDRLWSEARSEGWERGARLVFELVRDFAPECDIRFPADQMAAPPAVKAIAPDLLLQDLTTRQSAGVLASARVGGWGGLMARVLRSRTLGGNTHGPLATGPERGYLAWAVDRLSRTARELARSDVRRQSRQLAALSGLLDGHA